MLAKLLGFLAPLAIASSALAAPTPAPIQAFEGPAQGTSFHIRYVGEEQKDLPEAVAKRLSDFDQTFSNYRPDSEISRLNASSAEDWIPASPSLVELLQVAIDISKKTDGLFDVTLAPLIKAWGFGPYKKAEAAIPSTETIQKALGQSGYKNLELRQNPPAVRKKIKGLLIDLSGIAQGYAVDQIAAFLDSRGIHAYMVEIGGETITKGQKAPSVDWTIGVETPVAEPGTLSQIVTPRGLALATSGDYRNFFIKDGKRYSHILDPRSGSPIQHNLASLTVLAKTCTEADAYAKAYLILGPGKAEAFAAAKKMPILLILRTEKGFESRYGSGFKDFTR